MAKLIRSGEKLAKIVKTTENSIEYSIVGRRPFVSASQPQKYEVRMIAEK